jgi:hypothetical protein
MMDTVRYGAIRSVAVCWCGHRDADHDEEDRGAATSCSGGRCQRGCRLTPLDVAYAYESGTETERERLRNQRSASQGEER